MPALLETKVVRLKLRDLMEQYRITNKELGAKIGRHEGSVSRLKSAEKMPRMDSDDLELLAKGLTEVLRDRGFDITVVAKDLLDFGA